MTTRPNLRITLHDGRRLEVRTTLQDRLAFESTLRKNRSWGPLADNSLKLHPFMAWNAARRLGLIDDGMTWHDFTTGPTAALDVEVIEDEAEHDEAEHDDAGPLAVDGLGGDIPPARSTTYL